MRKELDKHEREQGDGDVGLLEIADELTIERPFGWVFFWDSKKYRETGELRYALAGNAPFIVERSDGSIHVTGTSHPIEYYMEVYEKRSSEDKTEMS